MPRRFPHPPGRGDRRPLQLEVREPSQLQLGAYLRIIRHRKYTIMAVIAVVVGLSLAFSAVHHRVYEAAAQVVVRPTTDSLLSGSSTAPLDPARTLETEIRVINGPEVKNAAKTALRLPHAPKVSAMAVSNADVIVITARRDQPEAAAATANAFAGAYINIRRQRAANAVMAETRQIQARITDLETQISQTSGPQRDALVQTEVFFRQKLAEAQVGDAIDGDDGATLVAPATVPMSPISPKPVRTAAWAFCFALVLGLGIAFLREYLDDTIRSKDDLIGVAPALMPIGLIPMTLGRDSRDTPHVVTLTDPQSAAAEAFRTMRTAIEFLNVDEDVCTVQITSPSGAEGKTTIAANLGVAMAQAGRRVVIVCCDFRRPALGKLFGIDDDIGLTSVILGQTSLNAAMRTVDPELPLFVLPSGVPPPNPAELLASKRTRQILDALAEQADVVILDCPPILPVADALEVSAYADVSLIVCRAGVTSRQRIAQAIELMRQVDAPLEAAVLNGVTVDETYGGTVRSYRPHIRRHDAGLGESDGSVAATPVSKAVHGLTQTSAPP